MKFDLKVVDGTDPDHLGDRFTLFGRRGDVDVPARHGHRVEADAGAKQLQAIGRGSHAAEPEENVSAAVG